MQNPGNAANNAQKRRPVNKWNGLAYRRILASELPSLARKHLGQGLSGDVDAAFSLVGAAPNRSRGLILVTAYCLGTPNPAYRAIVKSVWNHDHGQVISITRNHRAWIRKMMIEAEFDVSHLPDKVTIWRGTSGCSLAEAAKGLSWTTDYEVACWFAFNRVDVKRPLVLRAEVPRNDIILIDNSRKEREVVPRVGIDAKVDGTEPAWKATKDRLIAARQRHTLGQ